MVSQVQELEIGERPLGAVLQGSDALAEGAPVDAAVKWFNATKGYGFVELSDGGGDAFLHLKALREIGRQTLPSGAKMRVVARTGARGAEVLRSWRSTQGPPSSVRRGVQLLTRLPPST
jgi:cold shock CspA family protein